LINIIFAKKIDNCVMKKQHFTYYFLFGVLLTTIGLLGWVCLNIGEMSNALYQNKTLNAQSPYLPIPTVKTSTITLSPTSTKILTPSIEPALTETETLTPTLEYGQMEVIGYSVEGRPLEVYRFGIGEHPVMIVAGIHGGYEWNTVSLADQLIIELQNNPKMLPIDKTIYILPVLNPDGYNRDKGPDGRANANNVDINRNWDANWQANWTGVHCWNYRFITAGTGPGSEPETQALATFLIERKIIALISYHSAGLGIFPGGWPNDQKSIDLAFAVSQVSPYSYPPVETDCQFTGQLIDWASAQGIAAVDIELSNHIDSDLFYNLKILEEFLKFDMFIATPTTLVR